MNENKTNKLKIFNDPIYGFIAIPSTLIFDLIEHPYFQRLRRISQMGLSYLVYPGAHHTRFHHAIGCMHLMQKAVNVLRYKGVAISSVEEEAVSIAILLHDIGHGPFSHALEHSIVTNIHHEAISLRFMEALNKQFEGKLALAIKIFKGEYHRNFLYQLISSQLDMDRLDYLKRDSFYTGVAEGTINSERLIMMLNVQNNSLVVEEKGIYSIEKFLMARRLMYWQVYLHKTGLVAEQILQKVLQRAKELTSEAKIVPASKAFAYFLKKQSNFDTDSLEVFSKIDDYDVISALKSWTEHDDFILSKLSKMILNRRLPAVKMQDKPFDESQIKAIQQKIKLDCNCSDKALAYLVATGKISNQAYSIKNNGIQIIFKDGTTKDAVEASNHLDLKALVTPTVKHFLYYPKQ